MHAFNSRPVLCALLLLLTSCGAFHPKHQDAPAAAGAIQAGAVSVRFDGVTAFPQGDLQDALSDALDTIKTEGLNPATADDAAFFLELYYRKNGYAFVDTSYTIDNPKQLTLKVQEGQLVTLGDIKFTGNAHYPAPGNFQQYIIGQTRERFPASKSSLPYVETDVEKGADLIQRFYLSQGYLDAKIGSPAVEYVAGRTRADITVPITEGRLYRFGDVSIDGELIFPADQVRALVADQIALPYTKPRVDSMQRTLQDYYKRHGYYTASVTAASDPLSADADGRVATSFQVAPGPLYHFDGASVTGTDRLNPQFLKNRFKKLSGQVYDPAKLDEIYQQMIRTGLFNLLRVDPVVQADDTLRLDIGVKEAKPRDVGFSLGYSTYEGPILGFEIGDRDFRGTGRPVSFSVDYTARTLSAELLYQDPYFLETDNQLRLQFTILTRDLDSYTKDEVNGIAEIVRPLGKQVKVSAFILAKEVNIASYSIAAYNVGKQSYKTNSLGVTASYDTRDNPISPTRGFVTGGTFDVASSDLGGDINFLRGTYRATYFLPIGKTKMSLLAGFRMGLVAPFNGSDGSFYADTDHNPRTPEVPQGSLFPIDERFFNGGDTSVRSFGERELGPYDHHSGLPIGGQAYNIANVEYLFPVGVQDLRGAVFVDAGNLRPKWTQLGFDDERYAIGAGVRYNLPVGPLRVDYGVNPNPHRNEAFGAFSFSFGYAF